MVRGQVPHLAKTETKMTKLLPGVIAMAAIVVASNVLVQFLLLDGLLTWGAFTYPLAFLVTDVMNRIYGAAAARRVVLVGFVVGVICSLIGSQIMLQGDGFEFAAVPLRVAIGSGIGFLTAQLFDVFIFSKLRDRTWWKAPLVSTLVSSTVDTVLFFSIAFSATLAVFGAQANSDTAWAQDPAPLLTIGPDMPLWVTLAVADWGVKLTIALLALAPFRLITARIGQSATN